MSNQPKKKKKVTSATEWKRDKKTSELELPSGNVCLAKPVGMQVFLEKGMIPNSLLPIIQEAINTGKPPAMSDLKVSGGDLAEMSDLMDAVVCFCVLEPQVSPVPRDEAGTKLPLSSRDWDLLYVDEVDLTDKTFIFQFVVGGTRNLEQFRQESAAHMGTFQPGEAMELPPE